MAKRVSKSKVDVSDAAYEAKVEREYTKWEADKAVEAPKPERGIPSYVSSNARLVMAGLPPTARQSILDGEAKQHSDEAEIKRVEEILRGLSEADVKLLRRWLSPRARDDDPRLRERVRRGQQ